jgi:hypothetical protein
MSGDIQHENGDTEFISENDKGVLAVPDLPIPSYTEKPLSPRISHFSARNVTLTRITV